MQTPQDFIDEDLSLFYYTCPRAIVQLFKAHKTNATARLIFDYMLLNYSKKLNHTHKITTSDLATWLDAKKDYIRNAVGHLRKIGAIRKHPDKIEVYQIPGLNDLRNDLHAYRLARKEEAQQKRIAERIAEVEFDLNRPLNESEKARIETDMRRDEAYKERAKKKRAQTAAQFDLDLPFGDDEM